MARAEKRRPEDIRADISSQLFWDNRIDETNIKVEVTDSRVILTGTVPSYSDRWQAEDDAYSIPGVSYVDNRLRVSPSTFPIPSDEDIRGRVENVLNWNPTIDASRIDVATVNGVVKLTGAVDSCWQKKRAGYLASNVSGVIDVSNLLKVEPLARTTDEDIKRDIEESLARNAYVDPGNVEVRVRDGVVTLSGTVDDYLAYRTAEDIANYTSGVIEVNNDLVIT